MKNLLPILLMIALVPPGSLAWGSSVLPVSRPRIFRDALTYPTSPIDGVEMTSEGMSTPGLSLHVERFPGMTFKTASAPMLLPEPLVLGGLDVRINLLVQESTAGPSSMYGIGLMFTLENP